MKKPGRPKLKAKERRKVIAARVSPETFALIERKRREIKSNAGRALDELLSFSRL